jgi:plastocyanin
MRRTILLAGIAVLALTVGSAAAKTVTVTITKNGYVPNAATIALGDTVQFTNSDTIVHQVTFKTTTGITCTPNPLVVQPGASGTCTFQSGGNYTYSDPNSKGNTFRGSITVTAPPATLSLTANPLLVAYGGTSVVSGVLSTQQVGASIDVLVQQCGAATATKLATAVTTAGGVYTTTTKPLMNTTYTAKDKTVTSASATVTVRPILQLRRVGLRRFTLRVTAASSFAGKYASFQRYNGTLRRWVPVKPILLRASSAGIAPTVVSSASFRATVASRLRIRATLPQAQVGGCYAAGTSNATLS